MDGQSAAPRAAPAAPAAAQRGPPTLAVLALERLACSIAHQPTLCTAAGAVLPEELTLALFERVIELGKLTPKVLEVFQRTGHEALLERVAAMGIKSWIAPVLPIGTGGPLGFSRKPWS